MLISSREVFIPTAAIAVRSDQRDKGVVISVTLLGIMLREFKIAKPTKLTTNKGSRGGRFASLFALSRRDHMIILAMTTTGTSIQHE